LTVSQSNVEYNTYFNFKATAACFCIYWKSATLFPSVFTDTMAIIILLGCPQCRHRKSRRHQGWHRHRFSRRMNGVPSVARSNWIAQRDKTLATSSLYSSWAIHSDWPRPRSLIVIHCSVWWHRPRSLIVIHCSLWWPRPRSLIVIHCSVWWPRPRLLATNAPNHQYLFVITLFYVNAMAKILGIFRSFDDRQKQCKMWANKLLYIMLQNWHSSMSNTVLW